MRDANSRGFYLAWHWHSSSDFEGSGGVIGTSGNAYCSPVQARYDVETKGGIQSVTTNITQITSPVPDVSNMDYIDGPDGPNDTVVSSRQLASITYVTRHFFSAMHLYYTVRAVRN